MILETVYKLGDMLGLEQKDLNYLFPEKHNSDTINRVELPYSPLDNYKLEGGFYGTISIKDF